MSDWGNYWTDQKLSVLRDYLKSFQTALKNTFFQKLYIDALAGEGAQIIASENSLFADDENFAFEQIRMGSALEALRIEPLFDHFYLNGASPAKAQRLEEQIKAISVPRNRISISALDANECVGKICSNLSKNDRGVVLLDPWGMQIRWATVELIAKSARLDMWYLFPTQAVVRMLPRDGMPSANWANKLDQILGAEDWRQEFYRPVPKSDLFENDSIDMTRNVSFSNVERYLVRRLSSTFVGGSIVQSPLKIGRAANPIFSFCFASGNTSDAAKRLTATLANAVIRANRS